MKKIMTLAAIFAAVAMTFSACNKEEKPSGNNGGNNTENNGGENNGGENNGGENNGGGEYASPITIDGSFADWDALDASKVAVATCDPETVNFGLKVLKAYADEVFLNIYVELDPDIVVCRCSDVPCEHAEEPGNPLDIFFSTSKEQGGYNAFSDLCVEYFVQGTLFEAGEFTSWTGGMYMWTGEVHGDGWNWAEALSDVMATGAGSGDKYEIAIMMDVLGGVMDLGDKFYLGAVIEQGWDIAGVLPNAAVTDENTSGKGEMLEVTINK